MQHQPPDQNHLRPGKIVKNQRQQHQQVVLVKDNSYGVVDMHQQNYPGGYNDLQERENESEANQNFYGEEQDDDYDYDDQEEVEKGAASRQGIH